MPPLGNPSMLRVSDTLGRLAFRSMGIWKVLTSQPTDRVFSRFALQFNDAPSLDFRSAYCPVVNLFLRAPNADPDRAASHPQPGSADADLGL